jgi:hypothetical protein
VTSSVQIAGVLLVFGFLVIPAVAGLMATPRPGLALAIGWIFGFLGSLLGLLGSVQLDLPAAPSILVSLTLLLALLGAVLALRRTSAREDAPASSGARSGERPGSVPHDGIAAAGRVAGATKVERARRETAAVRGDE